MASDLIEICGLWVSTSKTSGQVFTSGTVRGDDPVVLEPGTKVFLFKNTNKKSDKAPDYRLMKAPAERAETPYSAPVSNKPQRNYTDEPLPF